MAAWALLSLLDMLSFAYRWGPVLLLPLFTLIVRPPPPPELPPSSKAKGPLPTSEGRLRRSLRGPLVGVINVNQASARELQRLPGVGPRLAGRIVKARRTERFDHPAELTRVRGIGAVSVARWVSYLRVGGQTTLGRRASSKEAPSSARSPEPASWLGAEPGLEGIGGEPGLQTEPGS